MFTFSCFDNLRNRRLTEYVRHCLFQNKIRLSYLSENLPLPIPCRTHSPPSPNHIRCLSPLDITKSDSTADINGE